MNRHLENKVFSNMKTNIATIARATATAVALSLVMSSLTSPLCLAQDSGQGGLEIVEIEGQLEGILGYQMKLVGQDKQPIAILMGDETHFNYSGTADPAVLAPELMVRFTAAFDQAGTPQTPLAALEIFRPVRGRRLPLDVQRSQTPGVYPIEEQNKKEAAAGKKPAKNNPQPQAPKTPPTATGAAIQNYQVVGMLAAVQGDQIRIAAGNFPLMLQLDPAIKITVTAADATFCQPGDAVKLNGLKSPQGVIQAESIHVTGAKPLGAIDPKASDRNQRNNKRGKPNTAPTANEKTKDLRANNAPADKQGNPKQK